MSEAFRKKVISTLVDEIALLTGGRFEQFGYKMMGVIYPAQWVERGTTIEGAPRGYTVDTSADGSSLVAEMSSESDYFHGKMTKPQRDLQHAVSLHPDVKRIWLLASQEAAAGETTKRANLETQFKKGRKPLEDVNILDARKIAEHIFDNLESEHFISIIADYLPSIGRLADENAFSHRVPKYSGYLSRPSIEDTVINRLDNTSCIVINGISGIGKSALVAQVAERLRQDFDVIIWYDACELKNVTELSDVDVRRSGARHNITSLLRRQKCLLILDDTELSLRQVAELDLGESKVILTSQIRSDPQSIILEDLDFDSARTLLEEGVSNPCSDQVFQRVFSNIGGYPLLLGALNRLAQEEGWEAVNDCCEDAIISVEDERHKKVCQRILIRHQAALTGELEFVKWSGGSRFVSDLAEVCVSSRAVKNLQKRAFLAATISGNIRVHDVVYQSICGVINTSAQNDTEFSRKLENYIGEKCEEEKPAFRRIVRFHAPLLKRLLSSKPCPSFVYAVALARTGGTPLDLLGDPVATAKKIASYVNWSGLEIEIRAVIESVEALYTLTSAAQGADAAKIDLQNNIVTLELLRDSPAAKGEILRDIKHHFAKMLVRLERVQDAEIEFQSILIDHPNFAAGRLQLGRILDRTRRKQDALDECKKIIAQYKDTQARVDPVLLEALRLLASLGTSDDLAPYQALIMSSLAEAREYDTALALRLVASVAQKTWYTMPQIVSRMFKAIEWRDAAPSSDSERFDWAQAHKAAAKVTDVSDPQRHDFLVAADEAYRSIVNPNSYYMMQHTEALVLLKKFVEANDLLDLITESEHNEFWWQRKAQALLGLNSIDAALEAINHGLQKLRDKKYKPAFLHDRYLIRKSLQETEAIEDLKAAIDALPKNDKYRQELELELAELS
ncbi:MAG: hypothetical protein M0R47_00350 [Methylobacter sp.]|jgi:tetratricopeptide (TPR) repeat protein|uniref:NB-ARC domain-containing protein n=1 Tax=Methylobacter sp. TaxID=2051955 RepID=UPI0025E7D08D|nr:NB-ARC domain-containing protein [Methylobacter sp.]MCK9618965.1 hypothetical protein [Methylobacter sp.]